MRFLPSFRGFATQLIAAVAGLRSTIYVFTYGWYSGFLIKSFDSTNTANVSSGRAWFINGAQ
jgi:hypothetical protein